MYTSNLPVPRELPDTPIDRNTELFGAQPVFALLGGDGRHIIPRVTIGSGTSRKRRFATPEQIDARKHAATRVVSTPAVHDPFGDDYEDPFADGYEAGDNRPPTGGGASSSSSTTVSHTANAHQAPLLRTASSWTLTHSLAPVDLDASQ